jgi:hypothetical protein
MHPRPLPLRVAQLGTWLVAWLVVGACQPSPTAQPPSETGSGSAAANATATSAGTPSPVATVDRAAGWRRDLATLVPGMEAIHPDLAHGTSAEALSAAVDALSASAEDASDDALMVGVARIAAMVSAGDGRDGHTGLFVWGTGSYLVDSLPLRLWLFGDEVVVVAALPPFEDLVDARIDTVEGRPIDEVLAAIDALIPRDNAETVRLVAPRFLLIPQVLRGLGIAGDGPIALGLTLSDGEADVRLVEPVPMAEYNAWAGPYGLHLPADPEVLSLSRIDDALWWQVMPDTRTLYVQYNRVEIESSATTAALEAALADSAIERAILDVRHNYGGEVRAIDPIERLFVSAAERLPGNVFLITGRNTFSAASLLVARLDAETDIRIVGEPMGGAPNAWGDAEELELPFSGLVVSVSSVHNIAVDPDDPRLTIEPDQPIALTREDWGDGIDPALESIIIVAP